MLVVVSYDVSTVSPKGARRLRRVAKTCKDYGQRVQFSVFECVVDPAQWTRFRQKLIDEIDPENWGCHFDLNSHCWGARLSYHCLKKLGDNLGADLFAHLVPSRIG